MVRSTGVDPVSGISNRRRHRIEDRREQILSAASTVFAEKGYQRATTREIAEQADVSEGLIYSYFENKDHLLLAILEKLANSGFEEFVAETEDHSLNQDILGKTLQIRHQFLDEVEPMMRATMGEAINNSHFRDHYFEMLVKPALHSMENEIENWIKNGQIKTTNTSAASRFLLAEIIGLFFLRAVNDPYMMENWQNNSFLHQISEYFIDGLKAVKEQNQD
ncbi:TetR/AcrR family transcriptional regulator [Leptolinea tardivitalis]|uniref:TetR/AcrR family transcriptional regulator n=1 Tax=Leptolinea tardivitalis TaxID=229920 RepID=UPI0007832DF2|nr:TetR/AcrR family transcriptional regulator [Leptolinea tardivitalis]GAP20779.1 transcriptional regulator, TetR family [Leptolinea tardivitalis]